MLAPNNSWLLKRLQPDLCWVNFFIYFFFACFPDLLNRPATEAPVNRFSSELRCSFHLFFLLPFHFFLPTFNWRLRVSLSACFLQVDLKDSIQFQASVFSCRTTVKKASIKNYQKKGNKNKKKKYFDLWHNKPYVYSLLQKNKLGFRFLLNATSIEPTKCLEEDKNNVGLKKYLVPGTL